MEGKYLTPSVFELYRAPRGTLTQIDKLNITAVSRANALIDVLNDMGNIGELQALEILDVARKTVAETVTLN